MTGREAAQAVIDTTRKHREVAYAAADHTGEGYAQAVAAEEEAWEARSAAKQVLRDHLYVTYGVDLITLQSLIQG